VFNGKFGSKMRLRLKMHLRKPRWGKVAYGSLKALWQKGERLIADRGYDSLPLRQRL